MREGRGRDSLGRHMSILDIIDFVIARTERDVTHQGYGFYRPENPHDFFPDGDCCSEKEIENHRLACEAWDRGEREGPVVAPKGSETLVGENGEWLGHVTRAPWGIGSYTARDPQIESVVAKLKAFRETHAATSDDEVMPPVDAEVVYGILWQVDELRDRICDARDSRLRWMKAATEVLGPEWNGTAEDAGKALARLRADVDIENAIDRNSGFVEEPAT